MAAASFGAGLIHISAIFDHTEHAVVATFFGVLAVVQVGWAAAMLRRPTARLLTAGALISAGVVLIWLLSRATGLPGVPGAEEPEAFSRKDGIASLLEVSLVAGVTARFVPRAQGLRLASNRLASALAVSVVGMVTAAGLSAGGHGHHHGGGLHGHSGSATADHGQGDEHHAGGDSAHGPTGHGHDAVSPGRHEAAHAHGSGGDRHGVGGHDHRSASFALAAGPADHDHHAPGHVHDPSHHHEPGHVHDPSHHHEPGHVHDPSHHHEPGHVHDPSHHHEPGHVHDPSHHHNQPGHSDQAGGPAEPGHDHGGGHHHEGGGDHPHGGGDRDDAEACTNPLPANQVITTLQETAQSTVGAGCQLQTSSPTGDPPRHSPLHRSAQHFIS